MSIAPALKYHSVADVAKIFGVSQGKVFAWIEAKELAAVNVSEKRNSQKPRWKISELALTAFAESRTNTTPGPAEKSGTRAAARQAKLPKPKRQWIK